MRVSGFPSLFPAIAVSKCAENPAIAGKESKTQKSSLVSKEKVHKESEHCAGISSHGDNKGVTSHRS